MLVQICSSMSKAAGIFMLLLINMLKLSALKETTSIMRSNTGYRSVG